MEARQQIVEAIVKKVNAISNEPVEAEFVSACLDYFEACGYKPVQIDGDLVYFERVPSNEERRKQIARELVARIYPSEAFDDAQIDAMVYLICLPMFMYLSCCALSAN